MGTFTQREDCEEFWVTDDKRATPKLWGTTEISQPFVIFMFKKEKRFPAFPINQAFSFSEKKASEDREEPSQMDPKLFS